MSVLNSSQIASLSALGFKRWTKGDMDRMYINAGALGLSCDYYGTGNIRDAYFNDVSISNSRARRLKEAKTYLDLVTMTIISVDELLAHAAATKVATAIGATYEANAWDRSIKLTLDHTAESC
jgi:hypothetical protein